MRGGGALLPEVGGIYWSFALIRNLRAELSAYRDHGLEPEDVAMDILAKYPDFGDRVPPPS